MRPPFLAIVAAVVAIMPVGAALGQTQVYQLNFTSSGTTQLAGGFTIVDTGSYAIAVPEPTSAAIAAVGAACVLRRRLRRRRSALQGG